MPAPLPTGTVTFLFTDIEGSTARWDEHPEAMRSALERHDELMRSAVEASGGHVFKTVGDAFCAAFATAGSALAAAVEAQRAVAAEAWGRFGEGFAPIRVRMGLHTGEAAERGGDYFGPPVNRVARIEAAGHGGQILLSSATRSRLDAEGLPEGLRLRDRGEHRLKDLRHTEHIVQVVVAGLPDVATALRTAGELRARDRIVVTDPNAAPDDDRDAATVMIRTVAETLDALEAVVRGDDRTVVLTADQVMAAAFRKPVDWREYRLGRIAEWSQPRYRLDGRFVGLTLLVDQGEQSVSGRWQAQEERYDDLGALLASVDDPAVVVLGPPGSGKSTLLRRMELDAAIAALQGAGDGVAGNLSTAPATLSHASPSPVDTPSPGNKRMASADASSVTFFVQLNQYAPERPGDPLPAPGEWLAERWAARFGHLARLDDLLAAGRVILLLDALNEMPAAGIADFHARVRLWKDWLVRLVMERPGNRVVFSCRSLDYSQPLSTPALRVPQVRIEPLGDEQVHEFLALYSPARWREVWAALEGTPQLEVVRSPYFLALLAEQVDANGELPEGRAALFTGFVRQALRREVERGGALFAPGTLLTGRDLARVAAWQWRSPWDLPERGMLVPKLAALAHAMQSDREGGAGGQVRVDVDTALNLVDHAEAEAIVAAGEALAVLDEDRAAEALMYVHQLVQEYFAARQLARAPDPELVRREWRADAISPSVAEVIDSLDPADELPPLPSTGWEETTVLAAAMSDDPGTFVRGVMETNLVLAGRAAVQPEVRERLGEELIEELRWALVHRSRDAAADLRDRIDCGYAVGELGDPRFERRGGPDGEYLLPPLVEIPGGRYPIGDDEPIDHHGELDTDHMPRHEVEVAAFAIGRYPVTNAEWRCFLEAGGYEDDRWWDTEAGRDWRRGVGTAAGVHAGVRRFIERCRRQPEIMERYLATGTWDQERYERGRQRVAMSSKALDAHLEELYPSGRLTEPSMWRDARFNRASQPVVGICWYEAQAYARWLAEQTGMPFRLPTEVEWEATARGRDARRYPYGDDFDRLNGNTVESHIRRPTAIGVFPGGDTPEGVCDLGGNVGEWTSSAYGDDPDEPDFRYPYDPGDGREELDTVPHRLRVLRGGSWFNAEFNARAVCRHGYFPTGRLTSRGVRLVCADRAPDPGPGPGHQSPSGRRSHRGQGARS